MEIQRNDSTSFGLITGNSGNVMNNTFENFNKNFQSTMDMLDTKLNQAFNSFRQGIYDDVVFNRIKFEINKKKNELLQEFNRLAATMCIPAPSLNNIPHSSHYIPQMSQLPHASNTLNDIDNADIRRYMEIPRYVTNKKPYYSPYSHYRGADIRRRLVNVPHLAKYNPHQNHVASDGAIIEKRYGQHERHEKMEKTTDYEKYFDDEMKSAIIKSQPDLINFEDSAEKDIEVAEESKSSSEETSISENKEMSENFTKSAVEDFAKSTLENPAASLLSKSSVVRSINHGSMKGKNILYINLIGKHISILTKRKSGERELEYYPCTYKLPPNLFSTHMKSQYSSEHGMKIISEHKKSILAILKEIGCEDDILTPTRDPYIIAFIIKAKNFSKIDWKIPESTLAGRKVWIFSPGREIIGGDAICEHKIYDSFVNFMYFI